MAESTYKGDSPGKKLARARMWLNASKTMQSLSVPYMGTIALAGEGGDASTLRGYGIEPSSVCFADYDAESVEYCQELYPGSYGHVGDVGDMSKEVLYNAAHLDFCGGLTIKNILTAATVARNGSWSRRTGSPDGCGASKPRIAPCGRWAASCCARPGPSSLSFVSTGRRHTSSSSSRTATRSHPSIR